VVEQILALIRSPLPRVRPHHEHLASCRPAVPYAYAENELAVTTIDAARVSNRCCRRLGGTRHDEAHTHARTGRAGNRGRDGAHRDRRTERARQRGPGG